MPALTTLLNVRNTTDESIYSARLWWWNPYTLINHELFTAVEEFGYIDRIAKLNLQQFVDLNREQIQKHSRDRLYEHKEQIEEITAHIRRGEDRHLEVKALLKPNEIEERWFERTINILFLGG